MPGPGLCLIMNLPDELLVHITGYLTTNKDVKMVRVVCRRFCNCSSLSFEGVFISANRRDIEVIREVAKHRKYAAQVKELVWQDAHFRRTNEKPGILSLVEDILQSTLFEEQADIIRNNWDGEALEKVLPCFLSLRKVTITDRIDRYLTPMMRAYEDKSFSPTMWSWTRFGRDPNWFSGSVWRGFVCVVDQIASSSIALKELVLDTNDRKGAGIPYEFFCRRPTDQREKVQRLEELCERGLELLELTFDIDELAFSGPGLLQLSRGTLPRIFHRATSLKHLTLHTSCQSVRERATGREDARILKAIPSECLDMLEHLTLSHMPVLTGDLLEFCRELTPELKTMRLIKLVLFDQTWAEALPRLKDALPWSNNGTEVTIVTDGENLPTHLATDLNLRIPNVTIYLTRYGGTTNPESWSLDLPVSDDED